MRRRNGLFWGALLILAGFLFLLDSLGLLPVSAWGLLWPLLLIVLGLWVLLRGDRRQRWGGMHDRWPASARPEIGGAVSPSDVPSRAAPAPESGASAQGQAAAPGATPGRQVSIPLAGTRQAQVRLEHGAGRLDVSALADASLLLTANSQRPLVHELHQEGATTVVHLHPELPGGFPFDWGRGAFDTVVSINRSVPVELDVRGGAAETYLDLGELQVKRVYLETGASSTGIRLPAQAGYTRVDVHAGAASVEIVAPQGVAARIRSEGGLNSTNVDTARFPRTADGFQSPDYETAANKADITTEMGLGSVTVR